MSDVFIRRHSGRVSLEVPDYLSRGDKNGIFSRRKNASGAIRMAALVEVPAEVTEALVASLRETPALREAPPYQIFKRLEVGEVPDNGPDTCFVFADVRTPADAPAHLDFSAVFNAVGTKFNLRVIGDGPTEAFRESCFHILHSVVVT